MKVLKSKRKNNTVFLEIEANHDLIEKEMEIAFKKYVKTAKIPGFRQGKISRNQFEKHYGKNILIQEAVSNSVNDAYRNAITELKLEIIDYPKNLNVDEYKEQQPLKFTCEVDVKPEVKLGKYKGVKVTQELKTISDEDVEKYLKDVLEQHAEYKTTDTGTTATGDILRVNMETSIDGTPYEPWTRQNAGLKLGLNAYGEELDTKLVGLKTGDKTEVETTLPADHRTAEVAGKKASFKIEVIEIRQKTYPELTPEFVEKVAGFKTLEDWKADIKEKLQTQSQNESEQKLHNDLLTAVAEDIKVDIQPILVEREIDNGMREFEHNIRQSGITMEQYLKFSKKESIDELRNEFKENAEKRVRAELALDAIAEEEKIQVNDEDLAIEIRRWGHPELSTDEQIQNYLQRMDKDRISTMIKKQKTLEFLVSNAKITKK